MSSSQETFTILNQGNDGDYGLGVKGDKVVTTLSNPLDPYQQWYMKFSGSNDTDGQPTFALINKGSNEAIRSQREIYGTTVVLAYTAATSKDNVTLWSLSKDDVNGYKYIRVAGAINLHMVPNSKRLTDGRAVDLADGTLITERWKFVPFSKDPLPVTNQAVRISCRAKQGYNLAIRRDAVELVPADPNDKNQIWIKDSSYTEHVKDEDKKQAFALIHKATGKAIKLGFGAGYLVQLGQFNPKVLDSSLLWTENEADASGFREIREQSNKSLVFHAFYVSESDLNKGALLTLQPKDGSVNQGWKFEEIFLWDARWGFFKDSTLINVPDAAGNAKPSSNQWNPSKAEISFDASA